MKVHVTEPLRTLPKRYAEAIGDLIVRWAYLENVLRYTAYEVLGVGPKEGRVAVRQPRAKELFLMWKDLAALKGIKTNSNFMKVANLLEKGESWRDWIAHGAWSEIDGVIHLQIITGNWTPMKGGPKVSRRVTPEGTQIRPEHIAQLSEAIENMTKGVERARDGMLNALAKQPPTPQ